MPFRTSRSPLLPSSTIRLSVAWLLLAVACTPAQPAATTALRRPPAAGVTTAPAAPPTTTPPETTPVSTTPTCPAVAPGLGDSLFPGFGNAGYDVQRYDLMLEVDIPEDLTRDRPVIEARASITAVATEALAAFNLDLVGMVVDTVEVDEAPAQWCRAGREFTVVPSETIAEGSDFVVFVRYHGQPGAEAGLYDDFVGLLRGRDGLYAIDEPDGAASWFPSNDHPADPAQFALSVTVPVGWDVVSAGDPSAPEEAASSTTFRWETVEPMATYLLPLAIGHFTQTSEEGPDGLPITLYIAEDLDDATGRAFRRQAQMVELLAEHYGPYPFDRLGGLVVNSQAPVALETQTLPTYTDAAIREFGEAVVVHELAHQWFGNWILLADWRDIWLNEGFATFSEWLWREQVVGLTAYDDDVASNYRFMAGHLPFSPEDAPPPAEPPSFDLFNASVYVWGGLVLVALRDSVGDDAFFGLVRSWVERFGGSHATTEDFLALVESQLGGDQRELVEDWILSETIPPMPERGLAPPE